MTQSEFKKHLELTTKLHAAEYGIDMIIDLCINLMDISEKAGKNGESFSTILEYARTVREEINKKPGGQS